MKVSYQTAKGTRDFSGLELKKRNYIINVIKNVFEKNDYEEIETPAFENLSTLNSKYENTESNELLFKIIDNGDNISNTSQKALRYDLTVPMARYVSNNLDNITFPYKRFQVQPVWRAEKPQKNRYREFYQADIDIIGSKSINCEVELLLISNEILKNLHIDYILKINNRKILEHIFNLLNLNISFNEFTIIIDKKDKIGTDLVINFFKEKDSSLSDESISLLEYVLNTKLDIFKLKELHSLFNLNVDIIENFIYLINKLNNNITNIEIDLSLARGINYYSGYIFEIISNDNENKSITISGGGRYDNLLSKFNKNINLTGVGLSLGIDRIYDIMEDKNIFNKINLNEKVKILFLNFGDQYSETINNIITKYYSTNEYIINRYIEFIKIDKQLKFANKKNYDYIIFVGENEIIENKFKIKNVKENTYSFLNL
jgi:histidyl-tRNA synthetase